MNNIQLTDTELDFLFCGLDLAEAELISRCNRFKSGELRYNVARNELQQISLLKIKIGKLLDSKELTY
jgi:hypothetical protein